MFDPQLEPLGLHTTRAALQNPHNYKRSAKGTHLAIYVEPLSKGAVDRAIYVRNIIRVARVFLPGIYRRWPGLKSFDVCQEPEAIVDPRPAPIPVTQLVRDEEGSRSARLEARVAGDPAEADAEARQRPTQRAALVVRVTAHARRTVVPGHARPRRAHVIADDERLVELGRRQRS